MYGSNINEISLKKLQITPMAILVLPNVLAYGSQNLVSCKYLFPSEEIYMAALSPYLIYTLFKSSVYFLYFSSINFTNSLSFSSS